MRKIGLDTHFWNKTSADQPGPVHQVFVSWLMPESNKTKDNPNVVEFILRPS